MTVPVVAASLLSAGLATPGAAQAAVRLTPASPLPMAAQKPVPVHAVRTRPLKLPVMRVPKPQPPSWPAAGTAEAAVDPSAFQARGASLAVHGPRDSRAGGLPVWVGPADPAGAGAADSPDDVEVTVASHPAALAAGVSGMLFTVGKTDRGPAQRVHVTISYASFAEAYGGDYASRLRLVELPGCALTTPQLTSCRKEMPLGSANDAVAGETGADVALPGGLTSVPAVAGGSSAMVVLAATASSSGSEGDFTATPLEQAGSWAEGGSSGAFTYSYPVQVPPVPGGLAPSVSLDYDSQTLDGMTSSTNDQASWIGDGWDYSPGYIERGYASCGQVSQELTAAGKADPVPASSDGSLCWSGDNTTTLVLNGQATTLVPTDSTDTTWRAESDGDEQIKYETGTANGTRFGGYFVLTEPDGTSFYFGVNELPGWVSGDASTESAQNVQVYGVESTDPCYSATWTSSVCDQTWQWNLSYVTDPHGNAMSYFYNGESNAYAAAGSADANDTYTRGETPWKIYYGLRAGTYYGSAAGTLATAGGEVYFTTSTDRTDVPTDLACTSGDACSQPSPTFWTKYELDDITTYALEGSGTSEALKEVDTWAVGHANNVTTDPDPDETAPLWLGSITRTGEDGTAIALPSVDFTGTYLANRVEPSTGDSYPTVSRERLTGIVTETGDKIGIGYDTPPGACSGTGTLPAEDANTGLCYPDWWNTGTASGTVESWFDKYVVTSVTQQNTAGGGVAVIDSYCYGGAGSAGSPACLAGGAWHHNDSPLSLSKDRTWDQWRGFGEVTTETGSSPDPVTETQGTYFQGMNGDYQAGGGTSTVNVTPSHGSAIPDSDQFAGMELEHVVCDGAAANASNGFCGDEVSDTITIPWTSAATATQTLTSPLPALQSFMTGTQETRTFTPGLASGGTRESDVTYTHDSYGRVTSVSDVPDTTDAALDTCAATTYASNTGAWILDLPGEVTTVSVPCGTTPTLPADAVSDDLTFYDGATSLSSDTPTTGNVSETEQATSYSGSTPQYTVEQQATYDTYGRILTSTDADGRETTTTYTAPATEEQPTTATVSAPTTQNGTTATTTELTTTTTYDQARDLPLTVTSPGGYVTTETYDSLGRLTAVWKPGDATSGSATEKFNYTVSNNAPSVTATLMLDSAGGYLTDETFYDSMGRELQTQDETADGKALVSDFNFDSDGWQLLVSNPYYIDEGPQSGTVAPASGDQVPSQTGYVYDGDGRVTQAISYTLANETWETDTAYGGDYTTVTYKNDVSGEPDGGAPETTFTNGEGENSAIWQYHSGVTPSVSDPASDYDLTSYAYTPAGQLQNINDASGNTWTYGYNLAGDQTSTSDPDTGTTNSTYDPAGQLSSVTDNRNDQVSYVYDADGRKTAEYNTTGGATESSSDELASWAYDTIKKGLPTSATSYYNGSAFTEQVTGYNVFGEPAGSATIIPSSFGGSLAGTWEQTNSVNSYTGQEDAYQDTADGGLPAEDVSIGLNAADQETALTSPAWDYVDTLAYTEWGQPQEYTLGTTATPAWIKDTEEEQDPTQLETSLMQTGTTPVTVDDTAYSYDNTGQITEEADTPATATAQVQCFTYDYLGHLSTAWSQASASCPSSGSQSAESGAAAGYWNQYQYDTAGDLTQVTATPPTGTATVTQTSYYGPDAQQTTTPEQPVHGISSVTVTPPSGGSESASYSYDQSGNLETVSGTAAPGGGQSFSWDDAGRLSSVKTSEGTTSYLYGADGNLLIQEDTPTTGDPTDTLYLPDEQVAQDNATKALSATRYYSIDGTTIAVRTSSGTLDYLDGDQQGTASLAVNASTLAVTRRYYDPYGNSIGTPASSWPGTQGFVGGTADPVTTLDNLGAREYQPATGTFTSPDPVLSPYDPQDLNPYAYAYDNPATDADPTGQLASYGGAEGGCTGTAQACAPILQNQQTGYDDQVISSAESQISSAATYAYDHRSYQMNTLLSALIPIPTGARLLFGQGRVGPEFLKGPVAGYTDVRALANAIKNGDVDPASIQLEGYINDDGDVVFTSSRRAYALARAGYIPEWFNRILPTKSMKLRENEISALGDELPSSRTVITPTINDRSFNVEDIVDWAELQAQKENSTSTAISEPLPPAQPGFLEQAGEEALESLDFDD